MNCEEPFVNKSVDVSNFFSVTTAATSMDKVSLILLLMLVLVALLLLSSQVMSPR